MAHSSQTMANAAIKAKRTNKAVRTGGIGHHIPCCCRDNRRAKTKVKRVQRWRQEITSPDTTTRNTLERLEARQPFHHTNFIK